MLQYPDAINSVVVEQIDEKAEGPCVLDRDNIRVVAKRSRTFISWLWTAKTKAGLL